MSKIQSVSVRSLSGARVPSLPQLSVIAGQAFTLHAVGADTTLFFSPDLIEILTPRPDASVSLTAGKAITYTFASADPGAYEIFFQPPQGNAPQTFDPPAADRTSFLLLLKSGPGDVVMPPPSMPPPSITSNPIQTLQAASATPQGLISDVEVEGFITSNPIQT